MPTRFAAPAAPQLARGAHGVVDKYHSPSTQTVPSEVPPLSRQPHHRWGRPQPQQQYLDAPRHVPGKGLRLAQLNIRSHHKVFAEQLCMDVLRSAAQMGVKTSGIIRLPSRTEFLSLLRDHTGRHKGAQDQVRPPSARAPSPRRPRLLAQKAPPPSPRAPAV